MKNTTKEPLFSHFALLGIGSFMIILLFVSFKDEKKFSLPGAVLVAAMALFASAFFVAGAVPLLRHYGRMRLKRKLMAKGIKAWASVEGILQGKNETNGKYSQHIICSFLDPKTGITNVFMSVGIWIDIEPAAKRTKKIPVYLDEANERSYYVETDMITEASTFCEPNDISDCLNEKMDPDLQNAYVENKAHPFIGILTSVMLAVCGIIFIGTALSLLLGVSFIFFGIIGLAAITKTSLKRTEYIKGQFIGASRESKSPCKLNNFLTYKFKCASEKDGVYYCRPTGTPPIFEKDRTYHLRVRGRMVTKIIS